MTEDERFDWVRRRGGEKYAAWLEAGFREHYCRSQESTPFLLQKRIRGDGGNTLFFINVWAFDWSDYSSWPGDPVTFLAETQFDARGDRRTFNVELLRPEDPPTTEAFFARIYRVMGCHPYEEAY